MIRRWTFLALLVSLFAPTAPLAAQDHWDAPGGLQCGTLLGAELFRPDLETYIQA